MTERSLLPVIPPFPNAWIPRPHQNDALTAFYAGLRRQINIWHRRAGKDDFGLNLAAIESQENIGNYWHLFPLQTQARKALWEGVNSAGYNTIDTVFPADLREQTLQADMLIKLKSGSTWQMAGSDRYNSLVGSNVRGVVFSEWALCNPLAWDYIRPILRENNGWVIFITTYRGKNHAYQMYENLNGLDGWYCSKLTIDDTMRHDGSPILTAADIQADRDEGMSEAMIQQEYYCSPEASHAGAYYGRQMADLNDSKRRGAFGYNPMLPLFAAFSRDTASVLSAVLVQPDGNMHNIVGSKSWDNMTVQDSFSELRTMFPFAKKIRTAIMPATAKIETMLSPGIEFECAPASSLIERIDVTRNLLPLTRIDVQIQAWGEEGNNIELLNSLQGYRADADAASPGMFQRLPAFVPEIHLATAFENYCMFSHAGGTRYGWSRPLDYTLHDRAPGVYQGANVTTPTDHRGYKRKASEANTAQI